MKDVKAPVLFNIGQPLEIAEIHLADPKPGEVRVRMVASGICHSCVSVANGQSGDVPLPMILGDEGAGVVDAVSPGCKILQPGDPVVISWAPSCSRCVYCTSGLPGLCDRTPPIGHMPDGSSRFSFDSSEVFHMGPSTYSPYVVVDESAAVKVSADMPLDKAALIGCAVTTGVGAVVNTARVRPGESVAVFGCGGVGLNAVQGARLAGAYPIYAVDVNGQKLELASRLGATESIDSSAVDPVEELRRATNDVGVDYAIVAVGAIPAMEQAVAALARAGTCVLIGSAPFGRTLTVDPAHLIRAERKLIGSRYGSSNPQVQFPRLVELYLAGHLKLDELITKTYQLSEINEAFEALSNGTDVRSVLVFEDS